jgi:hypothetical protein
MYGRFLAEAAAATGERRLAGMGTELTATGDLWEQVAAAFAAAAQAGNPADLLETATRRPPDRCTTSPTASKTFGNAWPPPSPPDGDERHDRRRRHLAALLGRTRCPPAGPAGSARPGRRWYRRGPRCRHGADAAVGSMPRRRVGRPPVPQMDRRPPAAGVPGRAGHPARRTTGRAGGGHRPRLVDRTGAPLKGRDGWRLARAHASHEGNALAVCSRLGLGRDLRAELLAEPLARWQWPDGGWNCDRRATGLRSSFHESLAPAWGLFEYWRATGEPAAREAALRTAELFLEHRLFRSLHTGQVIRRDWLTCTTPRTGTTPSSRRCSCSPGRGLPMTGAAATPSSSWNAAGGRTAAGSQAATGGNRPVRHAARWRSSTGADPRPAR